MSIRVWLLAALLPTAASAQDLVLENSSGVAQDQTYYTEDVGNNRLIFTKQNAEAAAHAADLAKRLQVLYQQSFGYTLDDTLAVGLMSSYNQIANGYSTQFPLNRQINYLGGAQSPDYFASSSWIDTLMIHETAHNYQINAKDNPVSRTIHTVLHNGSVLSNVLFPVLPNIFESNFITEGNAVLNESWHGVGGRLYSGRFRAMTNVHAKANTLTATRLFNQTLHFPYGESAYTFGGQYQYYLAENYGLDKTNLYFKNRSRYWYWPFMVNRPTQRTLGVSFDSALQSWAAQTKQAAQSMQLADGRPLARSKFFGPLNRVGDEILFLASPQAAHAPKLTRVNRQSGRVSRKSSHLSIGRVFLDNGKPYTVAAGKTSPWRIYQGLYSEGGYLKSGSKGKIHQGTLSDGREVYFNVVESYSKPQMYVGSQWYGAVNSSVLVLQDNLYYFVQNGRERTLYKNKEALVTIPGYYGFPVDVDADGHVYFIANTDTGSSLFRTNNGLIQRVLSADNVIDARLMGGNQVLAAAISHRDYYYSQEGMSLTDEQPFEVHLFWDEDDGLADQQVAAAQVPEQPLVTDTRYGFFRNMRYSSGNIALGFVSEDSDDDDSDDEDTDTDLVYSVSAVFSDPLARNQFSLWATRDEELSDLVGVGYSNNQFFLLAGVQAYYVANDGYQDNALNQQTRDSGVAAQLRLPFYESGRWRAELQSNYYQDYKLDEREPLSVQLDIDRSQRFGTSWITNEVFSLSAFGVEDRDDRITGGRVLFATDFSHEFYLRAQAKHAKSDTDLVDPLDRRGVELKDDANILGNDPSSFYVPALKDDVFAEQVDFAEISLNKVFNFSAYSFKGPVSLRREGFEVGLRRYNIDNANGVADTTINQLAISLNFDLLLLNIVPTSVSANYTYSDDDDIAESNHFSLGFFIPL